MAKINRDLEFLRKDDTYFMVLTLLYAISDDPKYSTINELAYVLDHNSFIRFIKYYEGQTIAVPSYNEIKDALRMLLLFKFCKIDGMPWKDALIAAGYSREDSMSARHKLTKFINHVDEYNYRLGGLLNIRKDD